MGGPKNDVTAQVDLSASHGNPAAVRSRDFIAQHMTPAQIAEAQKLARKWQEERSSE
jgi:hypothetical protein